MCEEGNGGSLLAGTTSTTTAMNILLPVGRRSGLNNELYTFDIQTASRDICADEDGKLAFTEGG